MTYRQARLFFIAVFIALDGAAITSVLVATDSQLRWAPLFLAAIVTTFGLVGCRLWINPEGW